MGRIEKAKDFKRVRANAESDIDLINQYSVRELKPGEVYCFSVVMCDNDVDRDLERFTDEALDELVPLFRGKTCIKDHAWGAGNQVARVYRAETELVSGKKNALGEPLKALVGSAYMVRNEANQPIIDAIDGGIMKEVSVGCNVRKCTCSICGKPQSLNYKTWKYQCEDGHARGDTYDGEKLCVGNLEGPTDAYELSFVAVPAQRGAGVTKAATDVGGAFDMLMTADIREYEDKARSLMPKLQATLVAAEERAVRAQIIAENAKYLNREGK